MRQLDTAEEAQLAHDIIRRIRSRIGFEARCAYEQHRTFDTEEAESHMLYFVWTHLNETRFLPLLVRWALGDYRKHAARNARHKQMPENAAEFYTARATNDGENVTVATHRKQTNREIKYRYNLANRERNRQAAAAYRAQRREAQPA